MPEDGDALEISHAGYTSSGHERGPRGQPAEASALILNCELSHPGMPSPSLNMPPHLTPSSSQAGTRAAIGPQGTLHRQKVLYAIRVEQFSPHKASGQRTRRKNSVGQLKFRLYKF